MTEAERAVIEAAIEWYQQCASSRTVAKLATITAALLAERTPPDPRDEVIRIARDMLSGPAKTYPRYARLAEALAKLDAANKDLT